MTENQYPPSVGLTRLFERTGRKGAKYVAGRLGFANILLLKTDKTAEDRTPIWFLRINERHEQTDHYRKPEPRDQVQDKQDWKRPAEQKPRQSFDDEVPF